MILDLVGATRLGLASTASLAGLDPDAVEDGESLAEAAARILREQEDAAAVAALRAQEVDLFRRAGLHWLPAGPGWALPIGDAGTLLLVPAGDLWHVYRTCRGVQPSRQTTRPLALDWARGVGEEIGRAHGGSISRAGARWRGQPATGPQRRLLAKFGLATRNASTELTKGAAADALTQYFAGQEMARLTGRRAAA